MYVAIGIEMGITFRGVVQPFSNVYHYDLPTAVTVPSEALVDDLVGHMKAFHSSDVSFLFGRVWEAGGTPSQNDMLFQKALTGVGLSSPNTSMDRERAYLFRWPAGKDVKGRPKYCRKWFHTGGSFGSVTPSTANLQNTAPFTAAQLTSLASIANDITDIGAGPEFWKLCTPRGERVTSGPTSHPYLEHHQLGDQWR